MENIPNAEEVKQPRMPKRNRFFEQEYIDTLDEGVIKDIFTTILRKSGNSDALKKFIPFKDIVSYQNMDNNVAATFYSDTHTITLNKYHVLQGGPNEEGGKEKTRSVTLASIIHEELHAVSSHHVTIDENLFEGVRQVGFQTESFDTVTQESITKTWVNFNEGITELIKDDILNEYIRRTGDKRDFYIQGFEEGEGKSSHQTYLEERVLVNDIFLRIASLLNLPLDIVREAFVQAYFSGILNEEIKGILREIGGDQLLFRMDDISHAELQERLKNSIEKHIRGSAVSEEESQKFAIEYIIIMCTNYMRRSLVN